MNDQSPREPNERPVAMITGASSGIGAEFARRLAEKGYDLILVARREALLRELCNELKNLYNINAEYIVAELTDPDDVNGIEERLNECENLQILINNAGFGIRGAFHEVGLDMQTGMLKVHCLVPLRLTHIALNKMLKRNKGSIINVSSTAAFLISPGSVIYCATKRFINSFTELLYIFLYNTNIKVQALCPGFTLTDFHTKLGIDPRVMNVHWMSSKDVVKNSLKCLEKGKVICIPGFRNKLMCLVVKIIPRRILYRIIIKHSRRREKSN